MDALNGGNKRERNALFFFVEIVSFKRHYFLMLGVVLHINYD